MYMDLYYKTLFLFFSEENIRFELFMFTYI